MTRGRVGKQIAESSNSKIRKQKWYLFQTQGLEPQGEPVRSPINVHDGD